MNNRRSLLQNIRLRKITLTDFRNIVHAEVDIPGGKMTEFIKGEPSILGLYGQNGSGKTSLLMAINALKHALSGREFLCSDFESCVRTGCSKARLEFELSSFNDAGIQIDLYYAFSMSVIQKDDDSNDKTSVNELISEWGPALTLMGYSESLVNKVFSENINMFISNDKKRIVISDELLQYAFTLPGGKKLNKQVLIDTTETAGRAFGNKKKYEQWTCNCEPGINEYLNDAKAEAVVQSKSFIFSTKVFKVLTAGSGLPEYKMILEDLSDYGKNYLFVILMDVTAANNIKMLPFSVWINNQEDGEGGFMWPLSLSAEYSSVPTQLYPYIESAVKSIGEVVSKIVPGLNIGIKSFGTIKISGIDQQKIDLTSIRNNVTIPLVYESDGIKRLVSLMSLLVAAYNNPSVTVAVDEIDSGIFEYILGELLSIMRESAKGQLVFTSHNLRPLEVLPHKNLLFTTVNPEKRFTKLEGISGNNNLRDSYFRTIILGTGKDAFYEATDTFAIEQSLFEAGLPKEIET